MPNTRSVCICVCVMTCLQLCITMFVSMYQYVHLFNCIRARSFFLALCENLWTYSFPFFFTTEVHLFSWVGVYIYKYVSEVCFLYLFCSSYVPLHLCWVFMQACFSIVVHWYLFRVVCLFPCVQFTGSVCVLLCIFFPFPPSMLYAVTWVCACMYLPVFIVWGVFLWWGGWWWNCLSFCFVFIFWCFPYVCIK